MGAVENPNGRVDVGEWGPPGSPGVPAGARVARHVWHPPAAAAVHLPPGYTLGFEAMAAGDGVRRFAPVGGAGAFNLEASLGGCALLTVRKNLDGERRFAYHAMRLLHQMGGLFLEHLSRRFDRLPDLCASGRSDPCRHVLPESLGQDARGEGEPWTPGVLVARGREAGGADATESECIRLGLIAAARINPLGPAEVTEEGGAALVRMALFDCGPCDSPLAADKADAVEEYLLDALKRHGEGDHAPGFWEWLFGDLDNIVHGISKRKGAKLSREEVRQALLDLVFRSYAYQGDCVHVLMRAFAAALPEPLTAPERALFDALYARQDHFGGLPFVVLEDRFDWLRTAAADHWGDPADPTRLGVLLRLLDYYGEMTRNKRRSDARAKAGAGHAPAAPLIEGRDVPSAPADPFQRIADEICERRGASCRCGSSAKWRALLTTDPLEEDPIEFSVECETCGEGGAVRVKREEFRAAAVG